MRKLYLDNIRWITVVLVVIYHVIYMYNGVVTAGVIGPFSETQYQDVFQYLVYPWFMLLLFVVSGTCARFYLKPYGQGISESKNSQASCSIHNRTLCIPVDFRLLQYGNGQCI